MEFLPDGGQGWLGQPECRLRLVHLPSYASNLDLIERFWHLMKRKVLFHKAYAKLALFKQAFDDVFEHCTSSRAPWQASSPIIPSHRKTRSRDFTRVEVYLAAECILMILRPPGTMWLRR